MVRCVPPAWQDVRAPQAPSRGSQVFSTASSAPAQPTKAAAPPPVPLAPEDPAEAEARKQRQLALQQDAARTLGKNAAAFSGKPKPPAADAGPASTTTLDNAGTTTLHKVGRRPDMNSLRTGSQVVSTTDQPRAADAGAAEPPRQGTRIASAGDFFSQASDSKGSSSRDEASREGRTEAETRDVAAPPPQPQDAEPARGPAAAAAAAEPVPGAMPQMRQPQTPAPPLSPTPPAQAQAVASYKETWREAANRNLFNILSNSRKARTASTTVSRASEVCVCVCVCVCIHVCVCVCICMSMIYGMYVYV